MSQPRFSLWMGTVDRPQFIQEAIFAIVEQSFEDWELIIVDCGNSIEYLLPLNSRIKYVHYEQKIGLEFIDVCAQMSNGVICNMASDDDVMLPGTLQHVYETIGNAKWLYGQLVTHPYGQVQGVPWSYEYLKRANIVPAPATFWKRELHDEFGIWDKNLACCDYDYWLRIGSKYEPVFTPRTLVRYRLHPGQDSQVRLGRVQAEAAMLSARAMSGYYGR